MTVRLFVVSALTATLVGAGVFYMTVTSLDPESGGVLSLTLFFLSLLLALAGFASLVGYFLRRLIFPHQFSVYAVRTALRQGAILSFFFSLLLWLQLLRLYRWWIAIIAVAILVFIELIFLSYDRTIKRGAAAHQE